MGAEPREIATGLWRRTARHPDWHPGAFGAEVASYAWPDPRVQTAVLTVDSQG